MTGARALAVVLLVALGAAGGLSVAAQQQPAPSMSVVGQENTSEFLSPDPGAVERTGQATPGLDVATAVSANAGDIQASHSLTQLERRYESADSDDRRRAVLRAGAQRTSERVDRLHQRELSTFQQYREGAIDDRELLRRLAEIHREATAVEETLRWIESRAGSSAVSNRAGTDRVRAVRLQSPLRERIAESFAGQRSFRVHVESSADGFVLAGIDRSSGGTYLRVAHDTSARSPTLQDNYDGVSDALDKVEALYPWTFDNSDGIDDARPVGPSSNRVYRIKVSHAHGSVETYLEGGSGEILHEFQRKDLERIPTTDLEETGETLRVEINATRSGGPLGVTAFDGTGTPVDATVAVNGDRIGSTGGDRLWTVAPAGQPTVNVSHGGETLSLEPTFE